MVFFIDDLFLRTLGLSLPPFDALWLMERLRDYTCQTAAQENLRKIDGLLKENRLLYELGEITREEYEATAKKLSGKRGIIEHENRLGLNNYKINVLNP